MQHAPCRGVEGGWARDHTPDRASQVAQLGLQQRPGEAGADALYVFRPRQPRQIGALRLRKGRPGPRVRLREQQGAPPQPARGAPAPQLLRQQHVVAPARVEQAHRLRQHPAVAGAGEAQYLGAHHDAGPGQEEQDAGGLEGGLVPICHEAGHVQGLHRLREPHRAAGILPVQPRGRQAVAVDLNEDIALALLPLCRGTDGRVVALDPGQGALAVRADAGQEGRVPRAVLRAPLPLLGERRASRLVLRPEVVDRAVPRHLRRALQIPQAVFLDRPPGAVEARGCGAVGHAVPQRRGDFLGESAVQPHRRHAPLDGLELLRPPEPAQEPRALHGDREAVAGPGLDLRDVGQRLLPEPRGRHQLGHLELQLQALPA
mmetsp:Transcript_120842/g.327936  ORF Transcript_120842/g.327936 Transcript_120842/m.327936 type:complete len:374 (-) Transcript_120842:163-1284(-)